jgi:hypothetical protein
MSDTLINLFPILPRHYIFIYYIKIIIIYTILLQLPSIYCTKCKKCDNALSALQARAKYLLYV